jgi:hypothetical protein
MRGLHPRREPLTRLRFAKPPSPTRGEGKTLAFNSNQPSFFKTHVRDLAASPREFCFKLSTLCNQRAQGMPGARRARSLACEIKKHTSVVTTGHTGITRHSLRNGFNGFLRSLPGDRAFLPPSLANYIRKLDTSVGVSERYDFAVRIKRVSSTAHHPRPPHPALNVCDDRETPLLR